MSSKEKIIVYCKDKSGKMQTYAVEEGSIPDALKAVKHEMAEDYQHPALAMIVGGKYNKPSSPPEKEAA